MMSIVLKAVLVVTMFLSLMTIAAVGEEISEDQGLRAEMDLLNLEQRIVSSYNDGLRFDIEEASRYQYLFSCDASYVAQGIVMAVTDIEQVRGLVNLTALSGNDAPARKVLSTFTLTSITRPGEPFLGALPASATALLRVDERGSWALLSEGTNAEGADKRILTRLAIEAAGLCLAPVPRHVVDSGVSRPIRWSASVPYKEGSQEFVSEPRPGGCYIAGMDMGFVDGGDIHTALLIEGTVATASRRQINLSRKRTYQENATVLKCPPK